MFSVLIIMDLLISSLFGGSIMFSSCSAGHPFVRSSVINKFCVTRYLFA